MHLYVIRHAQSTMNIGQGGGPNCSLSEVGRWQAGQIPSFFMDIQLDMIFCSPLRRVIQTATPLAKAQGLNIVLIPEMSEIFNEEWKDYRDYDWEACEQIVGEFPHAQFVEYQDMQHKWWPTWPENHAIVRKRVQKFVNAKLTDYYGTDMNIAVFGHGQTIADMKQIVNPGDIHPVYNAAIVHYVLDSEGQCVNVSLHKDHLGRHVYE
ncbi:histidine phosphatase family protein [Paenibacillus faecalis]|uniref:histidine phosphatase family protein n=1 Tax=Paenibacillus faecalis TaxID=2079532 RepID=UPI000D0F78F0|nr:histidine phosphatase family protein [Paenibacillus faecalis]